MTFAVHRKEMNKGCPDGTGRWLFEEFMFGDSVFGRAEVTYDFSITIHPHPYDPSRPADRTEVIVKNPTVADVVVFDDGGNVIPLTLEQVEELKKIVLEAFRDVEADVVSHVRGTL